MYLLSTKAEEVIKLQWHYHVHDERLLELKPSCTDAGLPLVTSWLNHLP